jgi:integron integrase
MLQQTPPKIKEKFEQALASAGVAVNQRPHFQHWLRCFLDFCLKYTQDPRLETSLEAFSQKLESKGQEPGKRHQALDAVRLYWDMLGSQSNRAGTGAPATGQAKFGFGGTDAGAESAGQAARKPDRSTTAVPQVVRPPGPDARRGAPPSVAAVGASAPERRGQAPVPPASPAREVPRSQAAPTSSLEPAQASGHYSNQYDGYAPGHGTGAATVSSPRLDRSAQRRARSAPPNAEASAAERDWRDVYDKLEVAIKVRHYSPKTLKSYRAWTRKLYGYVRPRAPATLTNEDVKAFLRYLAVEKHISASSQNQAFNALKFLFRHVLEKDFGQIEDVVRAKRKPNIPTVLSRQEVDRVIAELGYPYDLVAKLLYGCGLRLFECLKLRVQDVNLDMMILTVHDGKGKKDRTVPLPQTLRTEINLQLEQVAHVHQADLAAGYHGTFLPSALNLKYKNAAKELVWQWLFPAKTLTVVPDTGEHRRFHLHESHVQKAMKQAVQQSRIRKRASAQTLRHSYASHLLQANYDIRTIQELLGHSDVRTTMIYKHTIPSVSIKDAKSPLDL